MLHERTPPSQLQGPAPDSEPIKEVKPSLQVATVPAAVDMLCVLVCTHTPSRAGMGASVDGVVVVVLSW